MIAAIPIWVRLYRTLSIAGLLTVAAITLLVTGEIDAFTPIKMSPRFVIAFVVLATMSVTGLWVIDQWVSDIVFATSFLTTKNELMWYLVYATAFGGLAGVLFVIYFYRHDTAVGNITASWVIRRNGRERHPPGPGTFRTPMIARRSVDPGRAGAHRRLRARHGRFRAVVNASIPLALTFLSALIRREFDHEIGAPLALWIALASIFHAAGALGPYQTFGWYDSMTHTVSATLVAGVGYAVVDALDRSAESVELPGEFRFMFILVFVLAFGILWEIREFASTGRATVIGGKPVLAQYGTTDIVFDLLYNGVGALLVALWGTGYFDSAADLVSQRVGRPGGST